MFLEVFKKIICVCLCLCHVCSGALRGQEGVRSIKAEVTDGHKLLGTELESSERATRALNYLSCPEEKEKADWGHHNPA